MPAPSTDHFSGTFAPRERVGAPTHRDVGGSRVGPLGGPSAPWDGVGSLAPRPSGVTLDQIGASNNTHVLSQNSKSFDLNVNAPVFMPCPPAVENKALRPKSGIELELLNVYYCNARSLRNNLGELHDLLYSGKF